VLIFRGGILQWANFKHLETEKTGGEIKFLSPLLFDAEHKLFDHSQLESLSPQCLSFTAKPKLYS
jgi:hypothetical protein